MGCALTSHYHAKQISFLHVISRHTAITPLTLGIGSAHFTHYDNNHQCTDASSIPILSGVERANSTFFYLCMLGVPLHCRYRPVLFHNRSGIFTTTQTQGNTMKTMQKTAFAAVILAMVSVTNTANAKTEYHVYKKGSSSTCDISMKSPDKSGKSSSWKYIGKDSTRSGAKKIGKSVGCSSF